MRSQGANPAKKIYQVVARAGISNPDFKNNRKEEPVDAEQCEWMHEQPNPAHELSGVLVRKLAPGHLQNKSAMTHKRSHDPHDTGAALSDGLGPVNPRRDGRHIVTHDADLSVATSCAYAFTSGTKSACFIMLRKIVARFWCLQAIVRLKRLLVTNFGREGEHFRAPFRSQRSADPNDPSRAPA